MTELVFPRRIIYGEDASESLVILLDYLDARNILVVSDPVISGLELYKNLVSRLTETGRNIYEYKDVPPEPPVEIGDKIIETVKKHTIDAVIAIGGGSVIDAAKATHVKLHRPDVDVKDVAPFNPLGLEYSKPILIAIPTTAGTGSDASYGIVLTVHNETHYKMAVGSPEVVPYATILDQRFPMNAPRRIQVGAAVDALSHALEALSSNYSNPFSEALAEKAAILIFTELEKALSGDEEAWTKIHLAATMAGIAFTNSGLGLAHAIAHSIGGELKIHHGTMVGIVLPRVIKLNLRDDDASARLNRLKTLLEKIYGFEEKNSIVDHIVDFYKRIGQPTGVSELGVSKEKFTSVVEKMLDEVYHDPEMAYAPVIPDPEELKELIMSLYEPI